MANTPSPEHAPPSLPPMRFEGGDVIIKISSDPREWLLLHASVLRAASDYFNSFLQPIWGRPPIITDEKGEHNIEVYSLAMVIEDYTYFLKANAQPCDHGVGLDVNLLVNSEYDDTDLSADQVFEQPDATSPLYFRVMFALIYDLPISLQQIFADRKPSRYVGEQKLIAAVRFFSNVVALAKYHNCLEMVAPRLSKMLLQEPDIWMAISDAPEGFLILAKHLKCKQVYIEALRHVAYKTDVDALRTDVGAYETDAGEHKTHVELLAQHAGISESYAAEIHNYAQSVRRDSIADVKQVLLQLGLTHLDEQYAMADRRTSFINALSHRLSKAKKDKQRLRAEALARYVFGQRHGHGYTKDKPLPPFASACTDLMGAGGLEDPTAIFGHRVVKQHAAISADNPKSAATLAGMIHEKLVAIARDARLVIQNHCKPREEDEYKDRQRTGWPAKCGLFTHRGEFTASGLPHDRVPWSDDEREREAAGDLAGVSGKDDRTTPTITTVAALDAWVDLLGLNDGSRDDEAKEHSAECENCGH